MTAQNVYETETGYLYTAASPVANYHSTKVSVDPALISVLTGTPQAPAAVRALYIAAQQVVGKGLATPGRATQGKAIAGWIYGLVLAALLSTQLCSEVRADESVCFVQATGAGPVPCPVDSATNAQMIGILPTSSASSAVTSITSAAAENNHVLKASAGNLYGAYAVNLTATAGFLVIINSTTPPADGAITAIDFCTLPANGQCSINYIPGPPNNYSIGITAIVTSAATPLTKTTGTITAIIHGSVQ